MSKSGIRSQRYWKSSNPCGEGSSIRGYTLELLTAADMTTRVASTGGWAYLNPVPFTADDAFVKTSQGWLTVQVKAAQVWEGRRGLTLHFRKRRSSVSSDILALVSLDAMLVRYVAVSKPLPPELPKEATPLCQFLSSTVALANEPRSADLHTLKPSPVSSASAENNSTSRSRGPRGFDPVSTEKPEEVSKSEHTAHAAKAPNRRRVLPLAPEPVLDSGVED